MTYNSKKKLYSLAPSTFQMVFSVGDNGRVDAIPADNIPFMSWPDGRWCFAANSFMRHLYELNLSRRNGGTLKTYATQLSHLIRYCFDRRVDFTALSDDMFCRFVKSLQDEIGDHGKKVRDSTTVASIARVCLNFLAFLGKEKELDLVGPTGRISAIEKTIVIAAGRNGAPIQRKYWHHRSIPAPDPFKEIPPATLEQIEAVRRAAALDLISSNFIRKRRLAMICMLEITCGRRNEVALITTAAIYRAAEMEDPVLEVPRVKSKDPRPKLVPISRSDLRFLLEFIEINRASVIRRTCGSRNDQGTVLISETDGQSLMPNTVTQEISDLVKLAGLRSRLTPHMFRHRYITKLFVSLIEQHEIENEDDFRRALLSVSALKKKVMEITGHAKMSSLDRYIHLAFEEITNFKRTYDIVKARGVITSCQNHLQLIRDEITFGISSDIALQKLESIISLTLNDLTRLSIHEGGVTSSG